MKDNIKLDLLSEEIINVKFYVGTQYYSETSFDARQLYSLIISNNPIVLDEG